MKSRLIYIAGPYRGPTREAIEANIDMARQTAIKVLHQSGGRLYPVVPHLNTALFDFEPLLQNLSDQVYLHGTMSMMLQCSAVVTFGNWMMSVGTVAELAMARNYSIPCFGSVEELIQRTSVQLAIEDSEGF